MKTVILAILFLSSLCFGQGGARQFNGTNADAGSANSLNLGISGASSITIAFEEWQNSFSSTVQIFFELGANYNSSTGAFVIYSGSPSGTCTGNGIFMSMNVSGGSVYRVRQLPTASLPTSAAWHTYVFTMTSTGSNWNMYIDGASQTLTSCDISSPGTQTFTDAQLCIMARGCNSSLFNAGKISWLAVWKNVILSQNEATSLANCQNPWLIQPESLVHATYFTGQDSPEASYSALQAVGQNTPLLNTTVTAGPSGAGCEELQP